MPVADKPLRALDSSVAVPFLIEAHDDHALVSLWARRRPLVMTGHSLAETYSVLTRIPDDVRIAPDDAARMLTAGFATPLLLSRRTARDLPSVLAEHGVSGGAVYDALVGLAAKENGCVLATRDGRARATYEALGVQVEVVS
jgi:PIN domain.